MNRTQISETEYRWYADCEWSSIDGEVARAIWNGEVWNVSVYEYGQDRSLLPIVSHTSFPEVEDAEPWISEMMGAIKARLDHCDAIVRAAQEAEEARQREIAAQSDPTLQKLMKRLDRAKQDAANREVSHPSYGLSGWRERDEATIAGIEILIQNRKAELAAQREAA